MSSCKPCDPPPLPPPSPNPSSGTGAEQSSVRRGRRGGGGGTRLLHEGLLLHEAGVHTRLGLSSVSDPRCALTPGQFLHEAVALWQIRSTRKALARGARTRMALARGSCTRLILHKAGSLHARLARGSCTEADPILRASLAQGHTLIEGGSCTTVALAQGHLLHQSGSCTRTCIK